MKGSIRTLGAAVVAALLALPATAASQVSIGVGGGLSFGDLRGDGVDRADEEFGARTGFNAGGYVGIPLSDRLSLVPGLYYVQKGADVESEAGDDTTVELDYIEFPVVVDLAVTESDAPVGFSVFGGAQASWEVNSEVTDETTFLRETNSPDVGLIGGAKVDFPINETTAAVVMGGIDYGLNELEETTTVPGAPAPQEFRNTGYFVDVGLEWVVGS